MDDKAAIRQDSFRNRQVSVNQIITIEKMNDEKPLHGWLLYMDGDQGIHPQYVQLYRDACKRRGMSICLGWYQPDLLCEKDAVRQLKNQIAGYFADHCHGGVRYKTQLGQMLAHLVFAGDFADRDCLSGLCHCQRHHCLASLRDMVSRP